LILRYRNRKFCQISEYFHSLLSYVHLNAQVNCLAHKLIAQGIKPDEVVALLSDRGNEFLIMMLAIFKAGAAYLPLNPQHPEGRLQQVLAESQVRYVLSSSVYQHTISEICANLPSQVEVLTTESDVDQWLNPHSRHNERNLAFVIFTSGSTGKPKGAMVEHRGMYNNLITKVPTLGLTATDVIAQTAGQCFDISVWQHLTALVCGARVEVFSDIQVRDPQLLLPKLVETEVTILEAVPSMIQALLELAHDGFVMPKLRWLIACGEAFPPELCRRWMQRFPAVKVLNAYGPAECSDDVSYYAVPTLPEPTTLVIPVGKAVDNTQLYILNRDMQPVAIGIPGEICVGGIQVGRGYLNRPALTAAGFVPNPFNASGETLYRTGDLGRYRDDGSIEFLGRIDHQLKIRGFRIEPGEIEAQLLNHPHVEQAAVLVKEDKKGDKQLVAYLTANKIAAINHAELPRKLRSYLSETLPPYMVPAHFMLLPTMPLSANGKIDRKALPEADMREQLIETFVAPRNSTEEILVAIWQEVLEINQVGVKDNFFDLGGHSLLAVQVLSRVRRIFDIEISLRQLFESSTIEELAFFVEAMLIEKMTALSDEEVEMMLAAQENSEIE
jgi:amino acid adenylation domain-containing protein